jgi:exodeoxyribonuclease III
VRVATFNINNINKRLDNLLAWLAKAEPDVVSLQELKAEQEAFPVNALRTLGYEAVWQGERSWNAVAILARNQVPVLTCTTLPGNTEDHQARYIEAAVQGVLITSIYLPNGNPRLDRNSIDIGTPLGVQQRLMRHADIKTTMNTYGSAFEKTKRRANSRVADLVLPPAIKSQLKDRAKEVSLKNLRPETATIQ